VFLATTALPKFWGTRERIVFRAVVHLIQNSNSGATWIFMAPILGRTGKDTSGLLLPGPQSSCWKTWEFLNQCTGQIGPYYVSFWVRGCYILSMSITTLCLPAEAIRIAPI
jgi:hypothetical protein